ncbi:unnamed protein product [Arabis nemorensis]|uniref:Protein kinase domain-containing protein n=1 Tax=Arabis nemorensis TaxID=586526 RepID=A0A565B5K9_9BRAS|nr:unnamed protein product [Arabis nemorensis]
MVKMRQVRNPMPVLFISKVYKAENVETGEIVALKELKFDTANDLEIKILEKLNPHLNNNKEYMVFEYMDDDLDAFAKRVIFTPPDIKHYMKQLLTGLAYCHENQGDIKGELTIPKYALLILLAYLPS